MGVSSVYILVHSPSAVFTVALWGIHVSVHSPSAVSTVALWEDWWPAKSGQYCGYAN